MNNIIEAIIKKYGDDVRLCQPAKKITKLIPKELSNILTESNGIMETMIIPVTNTREDIQWIIYPQNRIVEDTGFYHNQYLIDGVVFSDDGAGNPYYMKSNGEIYLYEAIDGEENMIASSLFDFFTVSNNK